MMDVFVDDDDDDDNVDDVIVYHSNVLPAHGRRGRRRGRVIPHEFKNDSKDNSYVAKELVLKGKERAL
jgi:hypothetical protein